MWWGDPSGSQFQALGGTLWTVLALGCCASSTALLQRFGFSCVAEHMDLLRNNLISRKQESVTPLTSLWVMVKPLAGLAAQRL